MVTRVTTGYQNSTTANSVLSPSSGDSGLTLLNLGLKDSRDLFRDVALSPGKCGSFKLYLIHTETLKWDFEM